MKSQLHEYEVRSVTILGIAGGNDLQQIDRSRIKAVYGIDINQAIWMHAERSTEI